MSFIGSMFSNSKGSGFQGGTANILNPTTTGQANTAYGQTQDALAQQQNFLAALQAQNGLGNQSQVYNQLQGVVNGTGPNPAAAQLAQATGANTANQAALMAGQRGTGANPGLIARQAAQQGAANQQNAVGQAATLQANQSLNALSSAGNMANTQVANQASATTNLNSAAQGEQANLLNSINAQNNANVGMMSNINNANAGIAGINAQGQQNAVGSLTNAAGPAAMALLAHGGEVQAPTAPKKYADGGGVTGPSSTVGQFLASSVNGAAAPNIGGGPNIPTIKNAFSSSGGGGGSAPKPSASQSNPFAQIMNGTVAGGSSLDAVGGAGASDLPAAAMLAAHGGKVPAIVSPGELYLTPEEVKMVLAGRAKPSQVAERIPGKAKVKGDSLKNDTVKKNLDTGGVVVPRTKSKDDDTAASFVRAVAAKGSLKGKK